MPIKPDAACSAFLFAHQDDEFGVYSVIEDTARQSGRPVCIYLTSGSSDGNCAPMRNAESISVLSRLGVTPDDIHFIGTKFHIPDGRLVEHLASVYTMVHDHLTRYAPLAAIYIPAWEGGHQDHDAVHLIGLAVARKLRILAQVHQFPLYHGRGLPSRALRVLAPLAANGPVHTIPIPWSRRLRHLGLCLRYPSQLRVWIILFPLMTIDYFRHGVQRLQPVNLERPRLRPHQGSLLYERRTTLRHEQFMAVARPFIDRYLSETIQPEP